MKKIILILGFIFLNGILLAKNIVITSIQPLYSLTNYLVEGTDIEVYTPFGSDISMTISREAIRSEDTDLSIAKESQAVVDIAKIWKEDVIFGKARGYNIHLVEIDASYSYDDKMSTLFFNNYQNGEINPFIWTGSKNIIKMANIIARDLERIYPKNKGKINDNLVKFTKKVVDLEQKADKKMLGCQSNEVITLTENLQYLLNDLNVYTEYFDYKTINEENIKKMIDETGIKVVVSDRWVKKNIVKEIEKLGGQFIVLNTLDIPYDDDDKMDKDGLLKAYEDNVELLVEALNN